MGEHKIGRKLGCSGNDLAALVIGIGSKLHALIKRRGHRLLSALVSVTSYSYHLILRTNYLKRSIVASYPNYLCILCQADAEHAYDLL